jgi:pilus assembly protein CpaF
MIVVRVRSSHEEDVEQLTFDKPEILIGRDPAVSDVLAADGSVSKSHAIVARTSRGVLVTDLGSTNGTRVNGVLIVPSNPYRVQPEDEITIGAMSIWVLSREDGRPDARPSGPAAPNADRQVSLAGTVEARALGGHVPATAFEHRAPEKVEAPPAKTAPNEKGVAKTTSAKAAPAKATEPAKPTKAEVAAPKPAEAASGGGLMSRLTALLAGLKDALPLEPYTKTVKPSAELSKKLDAALEAQGAKLTGISAELRANVIAAARRELLETGPIGPWLDDPAISVIQCLRHDHIDLTRSGTVEPAEVVFSSSAALHLAMTRLAKQSGSEWAKAELVVERRINNGCRMVALLSPTSTNNLVLTIRKREPIQCAMDQLVARRSLSETMAAFLARCLELGINLLVTGPSEAMVFEVTSALASIALPDRRLAVVHAGGEVRVEGRRVTSFGLPVAAAEEEKALRAATLLGFDHIFVLSPKARSVASAAAAVVGGSSGFVVGVPLRTLGKALGTASAELALSRAGLGPDEAGRLVGHAFEVGVELAQTDEGAPFIRRIAEVSWGDARLSIRDLFVASQSEDGAARVFTAVQPSRLAGLAP